MWTKNRLRASDLCGVLQIFLTLRYRSRKCVWHRPHRPHTSTGIPGPSPSLTFSFAASDVVGNLVALLEMLRICRTHLHRLLRTDLQCVLDLICLDLLSHRHEIALLLGHRLICTVQQIFRNWTLDEGLGLPHGLANPIALLLESQNRLLVHPLLSFTD